MCEIYQKLKGKFIALTAYIRKEERSKINLSFHPRKLEKEEQCKPKVIRRIFF